MASLPCFWTSINFAMFLKILCCHGRFAMFSNKMVPRQITWILAYRASYSINLLLFMNKGRDENCHKLCKYQLHEWSAFWKKTWERGNGGEQNTCHRRWVPERTWRPRSAEEVDVDDERPCMRLPRGSTSSPPLPELPPRPPVSPSPP